MYLGQGESRGEINDEIALEIANGDEVGIRNQIAPAENRGVRGDVGGAEFDEDVEGGEEVDDAARDHQDSGQVVLHGQAVPARHEAEQVEEERIHEQRDQAYGEEDAVPFVHDFAARVQDLPPPFLLPLVDQGGRLRVVHLERWRGSCIIVMVEGWKGAGGKEAEAVKFVKREPNERLICIGWMFMNNYKNGMCDGRTKFKILTN